jgi:hypothetical protein
MNQVYIEPVTRIEIKIKYHVFINPSKIILEYNMEDPWRLKKILFPLK